jgi:hypothetical protein
MTASKHHPASLPVRAGVKVGRFAARGGDTVTLHGPTVGHTSGVESRSSVDDLAA